MTDRQASPPELDPTTREFFDSEEYYCYRTCSIFKCDLPRPATLRDADFLQTFFGESVQLPMLLPEVANFLVLLVTIALLIHIVIPVFTVIVWIVKRLFHLPKPLLRAAFIFEMQKILWRLLILQRRDITVQVKERR